MDIAGKCLMPHVDPLVEEIKRLDLTENVMELEAYGFTVIPPAKTGISAEWIGRLRDAIIGTVERRGNMDLSDWETRTTQVPHMARNWELLKEDDVFVEAALQPAGLAMARWLCGQTVSMAGHTLIAKGPTSPENMKNWTGELHSDLHGVPGGGDICHGCNVSILATDYAGADDGPTILAPGSHHAARAPLPSDMNSDVVALEGEAGSIAVWNDFTWHGSTPRKKPGLRLTLVQQYMRSYMRPLQQWREEDLAPGQLERYPDLRKLLAIDHPYPFHEEIERFGEFSWFMQAGTNRFA
ncbi:MAG: hypothetical protein CMQ07_01305 [Gammaproteobacteria bacterium]|nr:hypothetical protein [Gammaproteobacteria bacterium]